MAHTPTPYHVFSTGPGPGGMTNLICCQDGEGITTIAEVCHFFRNWRDNAEFIVRAANCFEDLVVALDALLWQWDNHGTLMGMALQDARAALSRAKKE